MTDPISLTGTAVGIVSLGLTVCQSLVSYYDSWKSHDEQVKEAVTRIEELENVLDVLSGRLARLPSDHEVSSQVQTLTVSCKASMKKLEDIFEECCKAGNPSTLKEKFQAQRRKALFPFKKDTLESIKATSRDVIGVLNIALQTLQVDIQVEQISMINEHFSKLDNTVAGQGSAIQANLAQISDRSERFEKSVLVDQARIMEALLSQKSSEERIIEALKSELQNFQLKLCQSPRLLETACNDAQRLGVFSEQPDITSLASSDFTHTPIRSLVPRNRCTCTTHPKGAKSFPITRSKFSFWRGTSSHSETCHFRYRDRTFGLGLRVCCFILSRAIQATLTVTQGAGGCSISSALKYRAIVPDNSPAFKIVYSAELEFTPGIDVQSLQHHIENLLQQLKKLFRDGKASPTDICQNEGSLLHAAIPAGDSLTSKCQNGLIENYHRWIFGLISLGVPTKEFDFYGRTATDRLLDHINDYGLKPDRRTGLGRIISDMLENTDVELTGTDAPITYHPPGDSRPEFVECVRVFEELFETLQWGPLCVAVVRKSETEVLRILTSNPDAISEENDRGQSPLHLSCNWPHGMSLLLQFGGTKIINRPDNINLLPLYYACTVGCVETVRLLLEADSAFFSKRAFVCHGDGDVLQRAVDCHADTLLPLLIPALVNRRNRLQQLAFEHLPEHLYNSLGICPDRILDKQAYQTYIALADNGVLVPASLTYSNRIQTVYHNFLTPRSAEMLFEAGFLDIDELDFQRATPLMYFNAWAGGEYILYLPWLLGKGAHIDCILPSLKAGDSKCMIVHQLAWMLGTSFFHVHFQQRNEQTLNQDGALSKFWLYPEQLRNVIAKFFGKPVFDECVCSCSNNGCCPATKFLLASSIWTRGSKCNKQQVRLWFIDWILGYIEKVGDCNGAPDWLLAEIIRFETFSKLCLTHTCRNMSLLYLDERPYYECLAHEEIKEIREEERLMIAQLDDLVAEFVAKYTELGVPLLEFFEGYWEDRMEEVLDKSGSVDEEEVRRLTELGVVLEE